jgi:hypothetical protein
MVRTYLPNVKKSAVTREVALTVTFLLHIQPLHFSLKNNVSAPSYDNSSKCDVLNPNAIYLDILIIISP